jgi:hypothetical protein
MAFGSVAHSQDSDSKLEKHPFINRPETILLQRRRVLQATFVCALSRGHRDLYRVLRVPDYSILTAPLVERLLCIPVNRRIKRFEQYTYQVSTRWTDNLYRSKYRVHLKRSVIHSHTLPCLHNSWVPKGDTPPLMTDPPTPEQLKLTEGALWIFYH